VLGSRAVLTWSMVIGAWVACVVFKAPATIVWGVNAAAVLTLMAE
jgi:hypothetical protein